MAIKIQSCADIEVPYTHWFFYGPARTGKTTSAASFPRPIILQPAQEGSEVALQGRDDVDFIKIHDSQEMDEALSHLEQRYAKARAAWDQGKNDEGFAHFPWETVIVESVTHYCDLMQEEFTRGGKLDMDRQLWGKLSSHLRNVQARLRDLPVHVVFVALAKTMTNDKRSIIAVEPAFPGQMSYKLPSACEAVVYFEKRPGNPTARFTAHFTTHGKAEAGTRFRELDALGKMEPFTFAQVQQHLGWTGA